MRRLFRALQSIAATAVVVCSLAVVSLAIMSTHGPSTPHPETGNVVPFNNHGGIHFITHHQDDLLWAAQTIALAALLIGIASRLILGKQEPDQLLNLNVASGSKNNGPEGTAP